MKGSHWTPTPRCLGPKPTHPSCTWPGPGRAASAPAFSSLSAHLRHLCPRPASSAATIRRGPGLWSPHLLSRRAAGNRGVARGSPSRPSRRPTPEGSAGLRWPPLRTARLHANGPPPPAFLLTASPPRARPAPGPARPGEKALIGKIAQEPGAEGGVRGHAISSSALAAWRRRPPG
jgi:hypothetical protein